MIHTIKHYSQFIILLVLFPVLLFAQQSDKSKLKEASKMPATGVSAHVSAAKHPARESYIIEGKREQELSKTEKNNLNETANKIAECVKQAEREFRNAGFKLWGTSVFLDNFINSEEKDKDKDLLEAKAGYAIEERVYQLMDKAGIKYEKQVRGYIKGSIPDILISVEDGKDALFDITASKSAGHIMDKGKPPGAWLTKPSVYFVEEIVYESFDHSDLQLLQNSKEAMAYKEFLKKKNPKRKNDEVLEVEKKRKKSSHEEKAIREQEEEELFEFLNTLRKDRPRNNKEKPEDSEEFKKFKSSIYADREKRARSRNVEHQKQLTLAKAKQEADEDEDDYS